MAAMSSIQRMCLPKLVKLETLCPFVIVVKSTLLVVILRGITSIFVFAHVIIICRLDTQNYEAVLADDSSTGSFNKVCLNLVPKRKYKTC